MSEGEHTKLNQSERDMNAFQREVLQQIKQGIDNARHEGVICEYPRGALIDGEWVPWPLDALDSSHSAESVNKP